MSISLNIKIVFDGLIILTIDLAPASSCPLCDSGGANDHTDDNRA